MFARSPACLALILLLAAGSVQAVGPSPAPGEAAENLLDSARLWEGKNRPDRERIALEKLLHAEPGNPQALLMLAQLEIRVKNITGATEFLKELQTYHPGHPMVAQIEEALRIAGRDRKKMDLIHSLVNSGRNEEAAAAARALFPSGPPGGGDLALEYYHVIGDTDKGWSEARRGLERLAQSSPNDMRYRLALARILTHRTSTLRTGMRMLAELAKRPDVDRQQVMDVWRRSLFGLDKDPGSVGYFREYLTLDPKDDVVRDRLTDARRAAAERWRIAHDPVQLARQEGLKQLDAGHLDEAERVLAGVLKQRPKDAQAIGGLGLVRLRQGRHAEAKEFFARARDLDADNRRKWSSLVVTADFWQLMREAAAARDQKNFSLAEDKAHAALRLEPDNADGIALLGNIYAERGMPFEAEQSYREAIRRDPGNSSALRGLVDLLQQQGRREAALALLDSLGDEHGADTKKYAALRAGILKDEADALLQQGREDEALPMLKNALLLAPENPWLRFDLARLYKKRGHPEDGLALMEDGLDLAADDVETLYANALYLEGMDQADDALFLLDKIAPAARTPGMLGLQQRMTTQSQIRRVAVLARAGRRDDALALLQRASDDAGDDAERVSSVANAWFDQGEPLRAVTLMHRMLERQAAPSLALRLRYAAMLNRAEQDDELAALLIRLATVPQMSDPDREEFRYLNSSLAARRADGLRQAGDIAAARTVLATALQLDPQNTDLLMAQARVDLAAGEPAQARDIYHRVLERVPQDAGVRLALARAMHESGDEDTARRQLDAVLAYAAADDVGTRLSVAGLLLDMNDTVAARRIVNRLQVVAPNNPRVLVQAGRIAKAEKRYDDAMAYFMQAKSAEAGTAAPSPEQAVAELSLSLSDKIHSAPAEGQLKERAWKQKNVALQVAYNLDGYPALTEPPAVAATETVAQLQTAVTPKPFSEQQPQTEADEEIARLQRRRQGSVATGVDYRGKPGTDGISTLSATELPVEVRLPVGYDGHAIVHLDPVKVSAGSLDLADLYDLRQYGKVLALAPAGLASAPVQSAKGIAIAAGYENDDMRVDIGTTPLGFPVTDIVGGFKKYGSQGPFYYSLDLARRPVTSSLLSYAGARDPVSGEVWGGVRSTGAGLHGGYDRGRFSASADLGYYLLNGRNVLNNTEFELRGGMDWEFIQQPDMRLSLGLAFTNWRYAENLRYYSFGHGGYYSPQSYYSFAVPVRWTGRKGRWSYLLKGSVSASVSYEKDMPFYPTDAALQAQGVANSAFATPVYTGGKGNGTGFYLGGALEYQVASHLFAGGRLEIDRSAYYTPNFLTFYLRYLFDPYTDPVPYPPEPVKPYSRF